MEHVLRGEFERKVMISVIELGNNTLIEQIQEFLSGKLSRKVSFGSIYTTLSRLKEKGFAESRKGSPTKIKGGRAKLYFSITDSGKIALEESERIQKEFKFPS